MNKVIPSFLVLAGSLFLAGLNFNAHADWPQHHGGHSVAKAEFSVPKAWPKELAAKWKVAVGDGVATPALVGDKVFVFTRQENGELLLCVDAATGKELWKTEKYDVLPANGPAAAFTGPRSTPAVSDGKVVTFGLRGMLSCFDAKDGKLLWRKEDFRGSFPQFFTSASPVIVDGLVIAALGGAKEGGVIAYDLNSGNEKWRWAGGAPSYASLISARVQGVKMVVAEMEKTMVGLAVKDGAVLWEVPWSARGANGVTPTVLGDVMVFGGPGKPTSAVKLTKDGEKFTAQELWNNPDAMMQFASPILKDGLVFGLAQNNNLICLGKDGKTAWSVPVNAPAPSPEANAGGNAPAGRRGGGGGGGGYGQIVDAGSVVLALTPASELIAFKPDEKSYQEIARIKVAGSPTYSYPVVSGKRIYIRDKQDLAMFMVD